MTEKSKMVKYLEEQIEGWELFLIEKKKEVDSSPYLEHSVRNIIKMYKEQIEEENGRQNKNLE